MDFGLGLGSTVVGVSKVEILCATHLSLSFSLSLSLKLKMRLGIRGKEDSGSDFGWGIKTPVVDGFLRVVVASGTIRAVNFI
jgi:hypothetical protein